MLNPNPELPDNIQIDRVQLPTRIRNALNAAGLRTVGEVREASDEGLLSLQNMASVQ
jgi:DNA-directed RNA polymerase alpha subunit